MILLIDIYHLFSHLILSYPFLSSLILSVLSSPILSALSSLILSCPFLSSLIFSCPLLSFPSLTVGLEAHDTTTYSGIRSLRPNILSKSKCCCLDLVPKGVPGVPPKCPKQITKRVKTESPSHQISCSKKVEILTRKRIAIIHPNPDRC